MRIGEARRTNRASIKEKAAPTPSQSCRRGLHRRPVKLAEEDYTDFDAKVEGAGTTSLCVDRLQANQEQKQWLNVSGCTLVGLVQKAPLSKYWTSEDYMTKRKAAQASRLKSVDVAQNRGGSRPWGNTQQLLEYKFGPKKASTLNTYAVMKSGFKKVDNGGKSAPIPSRRAQTRLVSGPSHVSTNPLEVLVNGDVVDTDVDDDDYYDEMNDSNSYDDDNHSYDNFEEDDGSDDISGSEDGSEDIIAEDDSDDIEDEDDTNDE